MAPPTARGKQIRTAFDASTITFEDGTAVTPLTLVVKYLQGGVTLDNLTPDGREYVNIESRGELLSRRKAGTTWPTISFSAKLDAVHASTDGTIVSWIHKLAPFASRVSTLTTISEDDHTHVIFTIERGGTDQVIRCEDVVFGPYSYSEADDGNNIPLTGTVYGEITIDDVVVFTPPRAS